MAFVAHRVQAFREGRAILPKRSEGRMKTYSSIIDARCWTDEVEDRRQYMIDLVQSDYSKCMGKFVPFTIIIDILLAEKNAQISDLHKKLAFYDSIVTDDQKRQFQTMEKELSGKHHVEGDQRVVTAVGEDGAAIHHEDQERVAPVREDGAAIHHEDQEGVAPVKEDGAAIHHEDQERVAPVREDGASIHHEDQERVAPVREDGAAIHDEVQEGVAPVGEDGAAIHDEVQEGVAPVGEDGAAIHDEVQEGVAAVREDGTTIHERKADHDECEEDVTCFDEIAKLEQEIDAMRDASRTPEEEVDLMCKELKLLKKYCEQFTEIQEENERLKASGEGSEQLQEENSKLKCRVIELEAQLKELCAEVEEGNNTCQELSKEVNNYSCQVGEITEESQCLQNEICRLKRQLDKLSSENKCLRQQNCKAKEIMCHHEEIVRERHSFKAKACALENRLKASRYDPLVDEKLEHHEEVVQERNCLRARICQLEKEFVSSGKTSEMETYCRTLMEKLDHHEEVVQERNCLRARVNQLEEELKCYQDIPQQVDKFEERSCVADEYEEERQDVQGRLSRLQELDKEASEERGSSQKVAFLENALEICKTELEKSKCCIKKLKEEKQELECAAEASLEIKEVGDCKRIALERDELKRKVDELCAVQCEFNKLLDQVRCYETIKAERDIYKDKYEKLMGLENEASELQLQVEEGKKLMEKRDQLKIQLENCENSIHDQEAEIDTLVFQVEELSQQNEEKQNQIKCYCEQLETKEGLICTLEDQLKCLQEQLCTAIKELTTEKNDLNVQICELEDYKEKLENELKCCKEKLEVMQRKEECCKTAYSNLKEELEQYMMSCQCAYEKIKELAAREQAMQCTIEQLQNQLCQAQDSCTSNSEENRLLKIEYATLKSNMEEKDALLVKLKVEVNEKEDSLSKMKSFLLQKDELCRNVFEKLRDKICCLVQENEQLRKVTKELAGASGDRHFRDLMQKSYVTAEKLSEELYKQYNKWDKMKMNTDKVTSLKNKVKKLKEELRCKKSDVSRVQYENKFIREALENEAEIDDLYLSRMRELNETIVRLETEKSYLQKGIEQASRCIDDSCDFLQSEFCDSPDTDPEICQKLKEQIKRIKQERETIGEEVKNVCSEKEELDTICDCTILREKLECLKREKCALQKQIKLLLATFSGFEATEAECECKKLKELLKPSGKGKKTDDGIDENDDGIDKNDDGIDKNVDGIHKNVDGIDKNVDGIDKNVDGIYKNVDGIDKRDDGIDKNVDGKYKGDDGIDENDDEIDENDDEIDENDECADLRRQIKKLQKENQNLKAGVESAGPISENAYQAEIDRLKGHLKEQGIKECNEEALKAEIERLKALTLEKDTAAQCDATKFESLEGELEALKAQLAKALSEKDEVNSKLDAFQGELGKLQAENAQLKNDTERIQNEAASQIPDLQSQLDKCKTENNNLKADLSKLQSENDQLKSDLQQAQSENDRLKQEVSQLKGDLQKAQDEAANLQRQLSNLQSENAQLKDEAASLKQKISSLESENSQLKNNLEQAQSENDRLKQEVSKLKGDLQNAQDEANRKISDLQSQINNLQSENGKLKSDLQRAQDEANNLKNEVSKLQGDINKLKDDVKRAQDDASAKLADLQQQLSKLQSENSQLKSDLQRANDESSKLQQEVNRMRGDVDKIRGDLQRAQDEAAKKLSELQSELSKFQSENSNLKSDLHKAQGDAAKLSDLQNQFSKLQSENGQLKSDLKRVEGESERKLGQLEKELGVLSDHNKKLVQKTSDIEDHNKNLKMQSDEFRAQATNQGELDALKKERNSLLAQLEALKKELAECSENIRKANEACKAELEKERKEKEALQAAMKDFEGKIGDISQKPVGRSISELERLLEEERRKNAVCEKAMAELKDQLSKSKGGGSQEDLSGLLDKESKDAAQAMKALADTKKKTADLEAENKRLMDELAKCKKQFRDKEARFSQEISEMKIENSKILDTTDVNVLKAEIARLKAELTKCKKQYDETIGFVKSDKDKKIKDMDRKYSDGVAKLQRSHEELLKDSSKDYEKEIDCLRKELQKCQETVCCLRKEMKCLEEKLRQAQEKDCKDISVNTQKPDLCRNKIGGVNIKSSTYDSKSCSAYIQPKKQSVSCSCGKAITCDVSCSAGQPFCVCVSKGVQKGDKRKSRESSKARSERSTGMDSGDEAAIKKVHKCLCGKPFESALYKVITTGLESLCTEEVQMVYKIICEHLAKTSAQERGKRISELRSREGTPDSVGRVKTRTERMKELECDLLQKQKCAQEKISCLQTTMKMEKQLLDELKAALELEKARNRELIEKIGLQTKTVCNLQAESEHVRREKQLSEEKVNILKSSIDEEKYRCKCLQAELEKEKGYSSQLKNLLENQRKSSTLQDQYKQKRGSAKAFYTELTTQKQKSVECKCSRSRLSKDEK